MRQGLLLLALVLAFPLGAAPAYAQELASGGPVEVGEEGLPLEDTYQTARTLAMGLGARASATSTSGVALNPAGMSLGRHYHAETLVGYEPSDTRFSLGGAVVDSYSGPINAGVAFRYLHGNGRTGHGGMDGRLALGLPLGETFAIGMTGRYLSYTSQRLNGSQPLAQGFTLDAAVRVSPIPGLHIAALGNNLIALGDEQGRALVPRTVGGSVTYTFDQVFTLAFDGLADLSYLDAPASADGSVQGQFGGAVELFTGEVPIRLGYVFDTARGNNGNGLHILTGGLGYVNRQMGIDLAVRQQLNGQQETLLIGSFRYFVH